MGKIITVLSGKGGVGKSCVARELGSRLDNSFVLDTDNVNGVQTEWFNDKYKCNLLKSEEKFTLNDEIKDKLPNYFIIDTKGGFDDVRLNKAIPKSDIFVVPVFIMIGALKGLTNTVLKIDDEVKDQKGKKTLIIVLNAVKKEKSMTKEYQEVLGQFLNAISSLMERVKNLDVYRVKIGNNDVVDKSERVKKSIRELRRDAKEKMNQNYYVEIDNDFERLANLIKKDK
jgi:cellulose biosynthesis protein BcsQ